MSEAVRAAVSDKPWSQFSESDYSIEQWRRACLIGPDEPSESKGDYKLPVREPDGTLNRNAVHAAAGGHGVSAVSGVSAEQTRAAAKKLVGLYRSQLDEDPPDSLVKLAGMGGGRAARPGRFCYRAFEFRAEQIASDGRTLEGYAAVFDSPARIDSWEGQFDEQIARGAFKRTLNARVPVLQFDHGQDARTGSVPIGAIREIREDKTGLLVRAELFDNDVVLPIRQAIGGGAIDGMSFRFRVNDDQWTRRDDDVDLRTVREVELFELGPVVFPAYEGTTVGVRSLLAHLDSGDRAALIRELAAELRAPDSEEPDPPVTSEEPTEPGQQATSGLSGDQRAALLRGLELMELR